MRPWPDPERLTEAQKLELIQRLHAERRQALDENARLAARVAELEQAKTASPKTPKNSFVPRSSTLTPNIPKGRRR